MRRELLYTIPIQAANQLHASFTQVARKEAKGKVGYYILLPLVFVLIPTSWLESRPSLCLYSRIWGVHCPGCGMTRAISCLVHGNFKKAFSYNKLVVIVFPLLCYLWLRGCKTAYTQSLLLKNRLQS